MDENREKLLERLLDAEGLDALRQATLETGLRQVRRRRKTRALLQASAALCLLACIVSAYQYWTDYTDRAAPPSQVPNLTATRTPPVEIINDEQLLSLFPGRPLALVGSPGHQQLVFLDQNRPEPPNQN